MIKATLGDYVAACGNSLPAGALLKHMEYLCAHSTIVVDEHKWYIKPREDMMLEVGPLVERADLHPERRRQGLNDAELGRAGGCVGIPKDYLATNRVPPLPSPKR
jgi:hypothetical protein